MSAARTVRSVLALVLAASTLVAAGSAAQAARPTLSVPAAVVGERVVATGRVGDAGRPRPVRLQRLSGRTWHTVATATSTKHGSFRVAVTQTTGPATYRAQASAIGRSRASTTPPRTVRPLAQRATLALPAEKGVDELATASAAFTPVRTGRPFVVERRDGSRWTVVARGTQGSRGTARTEVHVGSEPGRRTFRLTALRHRGAAPTSTTAGITVTAPSPTPVPPLAPDVVSVRPDGAPASFPSHAGASDRSGRWIAFTSTASDLGVSNPRGRGAVWLRDTAARTSVLVSRTSGGQVPDGESGEPSISADGRFVVYSSDASDIVDGDHDLDEDVFLFDRATGTTTLLSRRTLRTDDPDGRSFAPAVSANGRWVTWSSDDPGVTGHGWAQIVRHDRTTGSTVLVSTGPDGPGTDAPSIGSKVSDDGLVAFRSSSPRLTGRSTSHVSDVFLHAPGRSSLVNVTRAGNAGGSGSFDLSADGRRLVLQTQSWNLPGAQDSDDTSDVVLLEVQGMRFSLLSRSDHPSAEHRHPAISDDGGTVTWLSLRDEPDGSRVLQMIGYDVQRDLERPVTSVLERAPSASTVWPLDVSGDGRVALYRTRRPDLTGDPTGTYDQVVRQAVPALP